MKPLATRMRSTSRSVYPKTWSWSRRSGRRSTRCQCHKTFCP